MGLDSKEQRMNRIMPWLGAHLDPGEEVMAMDDVDVPVSRVGIGRTSEPVERMGTHD